jgi:two-component system OmpR family response regulator
MPNTTKLKKPTTTQKVLVVEDEGELGLVLNMVLSERDVELEYAGSLLAADEYLQNNKPSVIILDNKLPDGFGVDYISYIRKNYPGSKIIMISGFASVRDVALANGADIFFEKPFSLEEFNSAIDKLLN